LRPVLSLGNKQAQTHKSGEKDQKKSWHYEYNSSEFGPIELSVKDEGNQGKDTEQGHYAEHCPTKISSSCKEGKESGNT
jgi:hypothetical protein